MATFKRKYRSGKTVWFYQFALPGSTRENEARATGSGFGTKKEAQDAEATRRAEEQRRYEMAKAGAGVAAAVPTTLGSLLQEFFAQHAEQKLAPKTVERYRQHVAYLDPDLRAMPLGEITPLHLSREWQRLSKCGGHTRKDKTPRPLSAKSVRHVAGLVSSAFGRAIRWGLATTNPVTNSEPPVPKKHRAVALTAEQQATALNGAESVASPWCFGMFLKMAAGTGARRGEVLALRRSDIVDGRAFITRSLCQTRAGVEFKTTKNDNPHGVKIPESVLAAVEEHYRRQDEFRAKFGAAYRADLDLIFCNTDGSPLKPDSISASVSLLFRNLHFPKGTSLHSLRHTHTSHLLADGVDIATISARLGHSSIRTTQEIYAHMIHGKDDEAAAKWDEYQKRNTPARPEKEQVQ